MTFGAALLAWYDAARRDLPWRRRREPWAIWVSEVMLQQTRVEAVREPFERFLGRFPSPGAFAVAGDDELQAAWRGLGYYRRARLLREGARAVVERHGGEVPGDPAALAELPGVGDYTRGAIASIAFQRVEPAVDGNVERVFARLFALRGNPKAPALRRRIRELVVERIDRRRPGDFNQALMELGATVCTPRSPRCGECPLVGFCVGLREGVAERLPELPPRVRPVVVIARAVLAQVDGGRVLAMRLPDGAINAGQFDLPGPGVLHDCEDAAELAQVIAREHGAKVVPGPEVARVRHTITKHRITLCAHVAEVARRGRLQAVHPADPEVPWTTAARKVFAAVGGRVSAR